MYFETYQNIYYAEKDGVVLRPKGEAASFSFPAKTSEDKRYRLFAAGETTMFYQWKNEPDYPSNYHTVSDALDTKHAYKSQYCLDFSSTESISCIKRVYKRVMWPPVLSYLAMNPVDENWQAGIFVRTENLKLEPQGYLRMVVEIRYKKDGVHPRSVTQPPDHTVVLALKEGTTGWKKLARDIVIPREKTTSVSVWIEGTAYSGSVYLERPFLESESGFNLLPDFSMPVPEKTNFAWTAQNLSRKEWPKFKITLNNGTIFEGEIFERCHRRSEWETDIPRGLLQAENELRIELISDYHDPLPYEIFELALLEQPGGSIALISVSETAAAGGKAYALIRTEAADTKIQVSYLSEHIGGKTTYTFPEPGLHGIEIDCYSPCEKARFEITGCGKTVQAEIGRIVVRTDDGIITGTGDMVYIPQSKAEMDEYLSWYISNNIGNMITVRPVYRWSGTRVINADLWSDFVRIANELGLKYAVMQDGRELPGCDCNPDDEMMKGAGYLGLQHHELDGAMFYWGHTGRLTPIAESVFRMEHRIAQENPSHVKFTDFDTVFFSGNDMHINRNPEQKKDARTAAKNAVQILSAKRGHIPRHTGPSVMFKYMADAGFSWIGAETMYTSMEILMAFLRGGSCYIKNNSIGVHHAVQWSSSPQDSPEHIRRYRLALYVSYMQGATEINTEEGLWHLEEYYSHFSRFSSCCNSHKKQQQDFYRYIQTHSRTGEFYTPFAFLQGRYDGWHGFGNRNTWGWLGHKHTDAEHSWQLLKVFYPESEPGQDLYLHGCETDHAVGYYTGTPMGNADVIPAECGENVFLRYRALAFMGYNCASEEDMIKLKSYVTQGGKLILTRAHLTDTMLYCDIESNQLSYSKNPLSFTADKPVFKKTTYNGTEVEVCINTAAPDEIPTETDDGFPLVCVYRLGKGQVILFNVNAYPAHPAIRSLYEKELSKTMKQLTSEEPVWAECGNDVQFTVYKQADGVRHIYFLAVDWYKNPDTVRKAALIVGQNRYTVEIPFGVMLKCVVRNGIAAWAHSEAGEVIGIEESRVTVQGTGAVHFTIIHGEQLCEKTVDFADSSVKQIEL